MQIAVKYSELSAEIKKRYGYDIILDYVNGDTFNISFPIKMPIIGTKNIGLDIKVLGFDDMVLEVKAASDVLSKMVSLMPDLDISKYAVIEKDVFKILLANIEPLRNIFLYVRPTQLRFDESNIYLDVVTI